MVIEQLSFNEMYCKCELLSIALSFHSIPAIVGKIDLPIRYPTAMTFGGPNYQTMYVTTTNLNVNFDTNVFGSPASPPAGNLFVIDGLGVTGVRSYRPSFD